MGRRQAGGGSLMLWAMFYWETSGPAIHVDVTLTHTTYRSIGADHVHLFMQTVNPDGCGQKECFSLVVLGLTLVYLWPEGRSVNRPCWEWVGSLRMEAAILWTLWW